MGFEVPDFMKPYFKAKENGILPQYYLNWLKHLRDDYRDDLPDVDVRALVTLFDEGGHRFINDNYKCSGNYIFGLSGTLFSAVNDGVITDADLIEKIQKFRQHDFRFHYGEFTTQQEIDLINQILVDVIQYLEEQTPTA